MQPRDQPSAATKLAATYHGQPPKLNTHNVHTHTHAPLKPPAGRYHHEVRPAATLTPPVPAWKGPDTPGEDDDGADADGGAAPAQRKGQQV